MRERKMKYLQEKEEERRKAEEERIRKSMFLNLDETLFVRVDFYTIHQF